MSILCRHIWRTVSETTTKSKLQHAVEVFESIGSTEVRIPWKCGAERKLIQVFACIKCGKIKRYVTEL